MKAVYSELGPFILSLTMLYRAFLSLSCEIAACGLFILLISVLTMKRDWSNLKQQGVGPVPTIMKTEFCLNASCLFYNLFCLFSSALLVGLSLGEITASTLASKLPALPIGPTIIACLLIVLTCEILDGIESKKKSQFVG